MGVHADKLKAFHDTVSAQGPSAPIRIRLSDQDAIDLVDEVGAKALTHGANAVAAAKDLKASLAEKQPEGDALGEFVDRRRSAVAKLWDALNGQVINGVEISRKAS